MNLLMINPTRVIGALAAFAAASALSLQAQCTNNTGSTQQTIDGFGDSSAWCGVFSTAKQNSLWQTLGFSLLRIRIDQGGTLSNEAPWQDEISNAANAHAAGLKVFGTCWTVPSQWQTGNGEIITNDSAAYGTWLSQAASAHNLDWTSPQNEPDGANWTYNDYFNFMLNGSSQIVNSGRALMMPESWGFNDNYSDPSLNNSTTDSRITIVGGHLYAGGLYVHTNALNHGKHVWMTEYYFDGPNNIGACMSLAQNIQDCMNDQFSAYVYWWDNDNDTNTVMVLSSGAINKQGYVEGQFAKYIRPGATRVAATYTPQSGVYVTAYNSGGNLVIVALNENTGSVNQQFNISGGSVGSVQPYQTSASESMASLASINVGNNSFTTSLPSQSLTTFVQTSSGSGPANGTYKLIVKSSGQSMDVAGAATTNGTQIDQWPYHSASNEQWTITSIGSGLYTIIGVQSGKSVDCSNWGTANGTKVQIWTYDGGTNQKYLFTSAGGGYYEISPSYLTGSCLDEYGDTQTDGAVVDLWQSNGGANQQWSPEAP